MDDLLYLLLSDGADGLKLVVGQPPVITLEREKITLEGPPISTEEGEQFFRSISDSRQMRELRERGSIEFIYHFRKRAIFVVCAVKLNSKMAGNFRAAAAQRTQWPPPGSHQHECAKFGNITRA